MVEYLASEKALIVNLYDNEFGLIYIANPDIMEIWFNHNNDGSGCNNLVMMLLALSLI